MASDWTSHLIQLDPTGFGVEERGKERERKRRREFKRERESTFSLDFSATGLSNPGEAKGKVDPHCKGYAWVPGLGSFNNSGR